MNARIFLYTLIIFAASCERDIVQPEKKYTASTQITGDINGITNTGIISDHTTIKTFLDIHSGYFWSHDYHYEDHLEVSVNDNKGKMIFEDTTILYDVIRKNGVLYFQSKDTVCIAGDISADRWKYAPLYFKRETVAGTLMAKFLPCYYFIEAGNELHMPLVSFVQKIYVDSKYTSHSAFGNSNNTFDPGYFSRIKPSGNYADTVIYQNNTLVLKGIN